MLVPLLIASKAKQRIEQSVKSEYYPPVELEDIGTVSIHLATLNEEAFIEPTLQTLVSQRLYQQYRNTGLIELVLVDSHSEDRTVDIAKPYVDRIIIASRGKITARREAIELTDADIIVGVDSGDFYPPNFLNLLLRWFYDPEVVAVTGSEVPTHDVPLFLSMFQVFENFVYRRLQGRGMAMRRDAFFKAGGWNESVYQYNIVLVQIEEEQRLYYRLKSVGKVITDQQAVVYAVPRRFMPTRTPGLKKYQSEIGDKRF